MESEKVLLLRDLERAANEAEKSLILLADSHP